MRSAASSAPPHAAEAALLARMMLALRRALPRALSRRGPTLSLLVLLAAAALPATTLAAAYPAAAIKAVFLYRFAGYVRWPAPMDSARQFTIAVLGASDVAAQLSQLLPGQSVQGKPAQARVIQSAAQLGDAQMLYIGPDYDGDLRALINALRDQPVLVVTDSPDGLSAGGTVNFLIDKQHVRFEVSTVAARRAGLKISSDLLAVAEHVETGQIPVLCRPLSTHYLPCFIQVASHGPPEHGQPEQG